MNQLPEINKIYLKTGLILITAVFLYMALFIAGFIDLRFLDHERSGPAVKLLSSAILLWPGGIFIAAARSMRPNISKLSVTVYGKGAAIALIVLIPLALLDLIINGF